MFSIISAHIGQRQAEARARAHVVQRKLYALIERENFIRTAPRLIVKTCIPKSGREIK